MRLSLLAAAILVLAVPAIANEECATPALQDCSKLTGEAKSTCQAKNKEFALAQAKQGPPMKLPAGANKVNTLEDIFLAQFFDLTSQRETAVAPIVWEVVPAPER